MMAETETVSPSPEGESLAPFSNLSSIMTVTRCTQEVLDFEPSCLQFLEALGVSGWVLLALATVALLTLLLLYADTATYVLRYCPTRHKETTAIVLTVYPVLGLCSYLGLLFQKANLFLDLAAQLWFALCMWQFLDLTLSYFGGESRFVAKMKGAVLPWKGPPCCCWPCCICPKSTVSKRQIRFVKVLVIQHPWVQLVLSIFQITLWLEGWYTHMDMRPSSASLYIYLVSTISFFFGLWAFIVGFKASRVQLQEFHYTPKIVAFQLCLVFLRLQAIIVNSILVPSGAIPCLPPISPRVFANTLLNSLLLGQLVVLSVLARHFYKMPIPEVVTLTHTDELKDELLHKAVNGIGPKTGDDGTLPMKNGLIQSPPSDKEDAETGRLMNPTGDLAA
ncbi:organic solute transporter subunit alpha [Procambarus clarkii]|uniref:organic solute transporter subunit alpha n=1 Tax=Procambarus clarkii TaxID=6728 RepID=UPI001E67759B|nr:organic solute transporter subunit alpha-like [Procambarus clarkii]